MNVNVIFHVDEQSKWTLTLRNVQNLTRVVELKYSQIEVLANSEAVSSYVGSEPNSDVEMMQELASSGIRFVACNNALKGMGIPKEQLPQFVDIVPVGVLELVEKQRQGYAYIKP